MDDDLLACYTKEACSARTGTSILKGRSMITKVFADLRPLPNITNPFAHYITFQFNHLIHLHQEKDHAEQDPFDTTGTAIRNIVVVDMSMRSSVLIRQ